MAETDIGVKVTKSGKDVDTAIEDDFVLHSSRNCLKVKNPASTTITIAGGSGSRTIAHGQSFTPMVIAFIDYAGRRFFPSSASDATSDVFRMVIDSTNITFTALGATNGTYTIYYFVSESESAN